jgi:acetyl-CoA C-acetyltransferase
MSESVYILGGGRTDFKRNLKKEGKTIRHIIIEAGKKAIDDAKIDPAEIQAGAVGNFNAGQFTKQLQLGAFIPEIDPKLRGIPTMHTEAACASGALSVLLGAEWIMGGFYDVVLVVGAEQQKTMSITTMKSRNTAILCSLNCLGGSRKFTSRNMVLLKQTWL